MATFVRNGKRGKGSEIRSAVGIRGARLSPTYDGRYHEDFDGGMGKSWQGTMTDRVVTRADAAIVRTLRGPRSLDNVNGPLWTARKASKHSPTLPECDVMSLDGIVTNDDNQ